MTLELLRGRIIGNFGRHYLVEADSGEQVICHSRGKRAQAVVGDLVQWQRSADEGTIERVEDRRNWLFRRDEVRTKSFVANVDQILVVVAARPEMSLHQLSRVLIAAEAARIPAVIACNKKDLPEFNAAWARLQVFVQMGYRVLGWSLQSTDAAANAALDAELQKLLQGKATFVMGASGVGKSSLVNRLVPHANAEVAEISKALQSGKHTTTSTRWLWLDAERTTAVIDSPGFQDFGLSHIAPADLALLMPDIKARAGHCRFYNCTHRHEPGCSVLAAQDCAASVATFPSRYQIYSDIHDELMEMQHVRSF
jgi:ribosome biogenesis GTPase / thiamine phosphate phosphatase